MRTAETQPLHWDFPVGLLPMGILDAQRILAALRAWPGRSTQGLPLLARRLSGTCALVGSAGVGAGFDLAALASVDEADAPP